MKLSIFSVDYVMRRFEGEGENRAELPRTAAKTLLIGGESQEAALALAKRLTEASASENLNAQESVEMEPTMVTNIATDILVELPTADGDLIGKLHNAEATIEDLTKQLDGAKKAFDEAHASNELLSKSLQGSNEQLAAAGETIAKTQETNTILNEQLAQAKVALDRFSPAADHGDKPEAPVANQQANQS